MDLIANIIYKELTGKRDLIYSGKSQRDLSKTLQNYETEYEELLKKGRRIEKDIKVFKQLLGGILMTAASVNKAKKLLKGKNVPISIVIKKHFDKIYDIDQAILALETSQYGISNKIAKGLQIDQSTKIKKKLENLTDYYKKLKSDVRSLIKKAASKHVKATPELYKDAGAANNFFTKVKLTLKDAAAIEGKKPKADDDFYWVEEDSKGNLYFARYLRIKNLPKTMGGILPVFYLIVSQILYSPKFVKSKKTGKSTLKGNLSGLHLLSTTNKDVPLVKLIEKAHHSISESDKHGLDYKQLMLRLPELAYKSGISLWRTTPKIKQGALERLSNAGKINLLDKGSIKISKDGEHIIVSVPDSYILNERGEIDKDKAYDVCLKLASDAAKVVGIGKDRLAKGLTEKGRILPIPKKVSGVNTEDKALMQQVYPNKVKNGKAYWKFALLPVTREKMEVHVPDEEGEPRYVRPRDRSGEEEWKNMEDEAWIDKIAQKFSTHGDPLEPGE